MKKLMGLMLLSLFAVSLQSQATVFVGDLKISKVMCVRAPCPPLVSFTSGGNKPFAVRAVKGSVAETYLKLVAFKAKSSVSISVTIEGQIERENTIVATHIVSTENEAPPVKEASLVWTGWLDAHKVFCAKSPCPAQSSFKSEKGYAYGISPAAGTQAERFLDKLNTTMTGANARLKVRVVGTYIGRSMILNVTKIEVIK